MKSTLGMVLALLTLLELTFSSQIAFAANEITRLVPFQGRLHGGDNKIVSDGTYDLTFYIYETPTGGTSLWTETHPSVSVIHGYVNVLLGAISPMVESNYATQAPLYGENKNMVNFAEQKYLGISINGGAEMFPRSQLVPTFHAYTANHATHATQADNATQAENADKLDGKDSTYFAAASASNSRLATLEGKFTGAKAKDADKLDGLNSTNFMRTKTANGYAGMVLPDGSAFNWYRTTENGLIPFKAGGASSIGTSAWNFKNIYGTNIYDGNTLLENKYLGKTAKSVDADKLDGLNSTDFLRNTGKAVDADKLDGLDNTFFRNASNLNAGTIPIARLPITNRISMNASTNISDNYGHLYIGDMLIQYGRRASVAANRSETLAIKCFHSINSYVVTATYSSTSFDNPDAPTTAKNSNCSIRLSNPFNQARAIEWIAIGRKS